ncbi:precorrin-2 dehydrogenase/sirohydrochlorin ferrochelatase family protein [Levilactobacillus yiduensis]|uniref:precorrin-2 dehydrogenase/sirohydrochlorin ferrochelatase family protein n=1 Tax=Levilactobacillus yiduensis TaxID=2953880 RepID=UPI000EF2A959|nr:bifunctional precorrin-2 dehydrogenase/sirohydrochlorin ferrochelatase [Levilactobacillus yiduensis]AYM02469.1 bifunctional precorrin-2 dehydrogenase/sirohydrochlorin ferrochelatase [Levilactobacillus brevis]
MKKPYPVMLNLAHKSVAVIGGGQVAARKIKGLLSVQADVTVISPAISPQIDVRRVHWLAHGYQRADVDQMALIIACTDDPVVNQQVVDEADSLQWVNNTSDQTQSDFFNVAIVRENGIMVSVSTNGKSPTLAKKIKKQLQGWLQQNFGNHERS